MSEYDGSYVENHCGECGEYESECVCAELDAQDKPMRYKVWVIADSSGRWCTNSLEFDTEEQAREYGTDLAYRWLAVRLMEVHPVGVDPNSPVLGPEGVLA